VISFFEAKDEVASVLNEVPDMGSIGAEAILGQDDLQVRVVLPEFFEPSSTGVALTVVFVVAVMFEDGLRGQGYDLFSVRMDDDGGISL